MPRLRGPVVSRFARDHRLPSESPSGDGFAWLKMQREQVPGSPSGDGFASLRTPREYPPKTKTPPKIGGVVDESRCEF